MELLVLLVALAAVFLFFCLPGPTAGPGGTLLPDACRGGRPDRPSATDDRPTDETAGK